MPGPTATTPKLWLKADAGAYVNAGVTLATNGQTVQQWNDQSGNGNHASQATSGNRPTYKTGQLNSLPGIEFNGTSSYLTHNCLSEPRTVVLVAKYTGSAAYASWMGCKSNAASQFEGWYLHARFNTTYMGFQRCTTADTPGQPLPVWGAYLQRQESQADVWVVTNDDTTIKYRENLAVLATDTGTGTKLSLDGPGTIGAAYYNEVLGDYCAGQIYEILIYDVALSDAELLQLRDYLKRWSSLVDSSSPYSLITFLGNQYQEYLKLLSSADGTTFNLVTACGYAPPTGYTVRDPGYLKWGNYHFVFHTNKGWNGSGFNTCTTFSLAYSSDGYHYDFWSHIDVSSISGLNFAWAPEPYNDNGILRVFFVAGVGSSDFTVATFQVYEVHATAFDANNLPTSWSAPVQVTSTGDGFPTRTIDPFMVKVGSTYNLYWKHDAASGVPADNWIGRATASAITGISYAIQNSGQSYLNFADATEGASVVRLANGNLRCYVDQYDNGSGVGAGLGYVDSTDNGATWGTTHTVTAPFLTRHGSVILTPTADFTGTPLSGTQSVTTVFTDASIGAPTSWLWEKNNGSGWTNFSGSPTAQNPTETFGVGTWSVRMTATNASGSDTLTRTNYITATPSIPIFYLTQVAGIGPTGRF